MKYLIEYTDNTTDIVYTRNRIDLTKHIKQLTRLHKQNKKDSLTIQGHGLTATFHNVQELEATLNKTIKELADIGYTLKSKHEG